jgi:glutamate/tyrosine decarboxylase-like PLP-dependent enzyme
MNNLITKDLNNIESLLSLTQAQALTFLNSLKANSTYARIIDKIEVNLSQDGIGAEAALALFGEQYEALMVASAGPRYWGFVTGGTTPAALMGDWLASVYDQNTQTVRSEGDCSAQIEIDTIKLLLDLFELPDDFWGGFVTGATMSNFTCMAVGRQWLGKILGRDIAKEGVPAGLKILTATPHSSAVKSLAMLGIGSQNIIKIKTLEGNREAMDCTDLEAQIETLEGEPFILISSAGTVNTVDFDDFRAIHQLHQKYRFWWHIDAAFGGFAVCSPQYKHLLDSWQNADSITVDCHKWLNVPYDSAFFLVKNEHRLLQVETFQNSNAPYLGDPLQNFNYLNILPENSRRQRALPVWFTLMAYGKNGYQQIIENSIALAQQFGHWIDSHEHLELLAPVRLNTVCFTLKGDENQDHVQAFLSAVNTTGKVFMTPTVYQGRKGIRAAFVNWLTTEADLTIAQNIMNEALKL